MLMKWIYNFQSTESSISQIICKSTTVRNMRRTRADIQSSHSSVECMMIQALYHPWEERSAPRKCKRDWHNLCYELVKTRGDQHQLRPLQALGAHSPT